MVVATALPACSVDMPLPPPFGSPKDQQEDRAPTPSQPSPSQRFLSQMLPALAPPSQSSAPRQTQRHSTSTFLPDAPSSTAAVPRAPTSATSGSSTPYKSALRLSHPPPAPSTSNLQQHDTPQSKRPRLVGHGPTSLTSTSPLLQAGNDPSRSNAGPVPGESLSSPSQNVRPLSGMARPLPLPPTPSTSQRTTPLTLRNTPLMTMPQHSVEDFEKLLPRRQPAVEPLLHSDAPRHALLRAIPPPPRLPPSPVPTRDQGAAQQVLQHQSTVEALQRRRECLLTGFRSLDKDFERIAEISSLEHQRHTEAEKSDGAPHESADDACRIGGSYLGSSDRGLPSGSIVEVLGPPGSGKSSIMVQMAVTERLRALGRARRDLTPHHHDQDPQPDPYNGPKLTEDESEPTDAIYFSEDYWDAEIATADQILMVDCEGALTAEKIADAAWSFAISLWSSLRQAQESSSSVRAADMPPSSLPTNTRQQRADMPEVVRRLVAATLAGISVSRVTSLAGLIALLHSLRPTDEWQDPLQKGALPTSLPARTSLILIDSLSYHIRLSGGSNSDRKAGIALSERIRDMLLRLQQPFEYRPKPGLAAEEQEAARHRSSEAASKLCTPTIVFSNQLGIRRNRDELHGSSRSNSSGSRLRGPSRPANRNGIAGETSAMLAPILNGMRPPQPARVRDEPPAPSVALCGPEMWDDDECESTAAATLRQFQQQRGRGGVPNNAAQHVGHDRGWPPSFLGQDVWRILLFRHGIWGHRYAQMVSVPPGVASELSDLWAQTRDRVRARADLEQAAMADGAVEERVEAQQAADGTGSEAGAGAATKNDRDEQMLRLLSELRSSLFRWRPFHVSEQGLVA